MSERGYIFKYEPIINTKILLFNEEVVSFLSEQNLINGNEITVSLKHNHAENLEFLKKKHLLMNANLIEYFNLGLEDFEIIKAIIHFLEQNPFMSRELLQINHSLPI